MSRFLLKIRIMDIFIDLLSSTYKTCNRLQRINNRQKPDKHGQFNY